ncbi:MAG: hypothetical protein WKF43_03900 [Acidimicrobiales bacterium]
MDMRRRRWVGAVLVSVVALVVAACGIDADSVATSGPVSVESGPVQPQDTQIDTPTTRPTTTIPAITEDGLQVVAADLQEFWADTFPDLFGGEYEPVADNRIIAAVPGVEIPPCEGERISYDDVVGNAFAANCSEGPLVVWDEEQLITELDRRFGPVAAAIVLAHEWGHIAQFQGGVVDLPTVISEQQADCFAGSWLADTLDDPDDLDELENANPLDASLSSIIEFRDAAGSDPNDSRAHGSGFDRVRALQEGFDRGAAFCAGYAENFPSLTEIPFTSPQDAATGGNLPLDELVDLAVADLNIFYGREVDGFEGATAEDVLADEETVALLQDLSDKIGDAAAGLVLGMVWATFAQRQVGADEDRNEVGQVLQQACLSGGWLRTLLEKDDADTERQLELSPGDLDESILALIELAEVEEGFQDAEDSGVFELVADLRQGVTEGFDSCGLRR